MSSQIAQCHSQVLSVATTIIAAASIAVSVDCAHTYETTSTALGVVSVRSGSGPHIVNVGAEAMSGETRKHQASVALDAEEERIERACRWATSHARSLAAATDDALEDRIAALMDRERADAVRRPILKRRQG